jgi:uncharacterized protein YjbJ (UPF0337 family)
MIDQLVLEGNWNEIQGKLRQKWGQLTDDDVLQFRGDAQEMIGVIHRRTGEAREAIEQYLQEVCDRDASALGTAAEAIRDVTQHAGEALQQKARQAADGVRAGYDGAERFVRDRPAESLAVCFGIGVITGVVLAWWLRP